MYTILYYTIHVGTLCYATLCYATLRYATLILRTLSVENGQRKEERDKKYSPTIISYTILYTTLGPTLLYSTLYKSIVLICLGQCIDYSSTVATTNLFCPLQFPPLVFTQLSFFLRVFFVICDRTSRKTLVVLMLP